VPSYESNQAFVRAAIGELQDYLLSPELFWTISAQPPPGSPPFLQLTLGNVFLALDRLQAGGEHPGATLWIDTQPLVAAWDAAQARWPAQFERKAVRELASRVRQWKSYVHDVIETQSAGDYAGNVRPRLVAERLLDWLPDQPTTAEARSQLAQLDSRLAPYLEPGPLVHDAGMAVRYPAGTFPFLYRQPRPKPRA